MKKVFSILVAICMAFTLVPSAMAEETVTYVIQGDANLFAPPQGRFSSIFYTLIDSDGNELENVQWSISGTIPQGVLFDEITGNVVLNGSTIKNGTFTLTATYNGETVATKDVTVVDARHYYDFAGQDADVNPTANPTKLSDGTELSSIIPNQKAKTAKESNGNTYVNATSYTNYFAVKPQNANSAWKNARYITVEFDMINPTGTTFFKENKEYEVQLYAKNNKLYSKKDGDELASWNFSSTEWTKFQVVFDYYNYKYTIITESATFGPYNMLKTTDSNNYAEVLYFEKAVDNIAIYSGKPVESNLSINVIPEISVGSKAVKIPLPKTGEITIGDMTSSVAVNWETSSTGASIVDNKYLVIASGTVNDIILTASGGDLEKDYTIAISQALETVPNDNKVSIDYLGGISKVEAAYSGTGAVLKGLNEDYDLPDEGILHIYIDDTEKKYSVMCNGKTIGGGLGIAYTTLSDIEISGATITQIYAGGIFEEKPMILDAELSTTPVVGQSVGVNYKYFSMLYEKEEESVVWYINGEEEQVSTNFAIDKSMVDKTIKAIVTVSGGGQTSEPAETSTETIRDIYEVSIDGNGIKIKILSIEEDAENNGFILGAEWKNDGQCVGKLVKKIDYVGDTYIITAPTTFDDARVWLMYNDLTPIAGDKYASGATVNYAPSEKEQVGISYEDGALYIKGASAAMTTVVIYKPMDNEDFTQSKSFPFGILTAEDEVDMDAYIAYMGVITPDVKIQLDETFSGLYKTETITSNGKNVKEFIIGEEKLFTANKLQTLTKTEFEKVMILTGSSAGYDKYHEAEPSVVKTLMQGEEYDMAELETAILLSLYLGDKNNKNELVTNLAARSLDTKGVELMVKNQNFENSASLVKLDSGIEKALESIFETAVLQGIDNSINYLDTKVYLEAVVEGNVSDSMALDFTGDYFESLSALISTIQNYSPQGGAGNGGNSGSNGEGITGSTGNTGFISSGGGGGGGSSKESKEEEPKHESSFKDVSASHWAYDDINYLTQKNIISGMGDGSFAPERTITRAEYVKILSAAFPIKKTTDAIEFGDVEKTSWYYGYINAASAAGIISGDGSSFRPNDNISRQDAAVMLYRLLKSLNVNFEDNESKATDIHEISNYALEAVNALYSAEILKGTDDGRFMPRTSITRAQAAAIVARILRK